VLRLREDNTTTFLRIVRQKELGLHAVGREHLVRDRGRVSQRERAQKFVANKSVPRDGVFVILKGGLSAVGCTNPNLA
jgi:hypothetical protein